MYYMYKLAGVVLMLPCGLFALTGNVGAAVGFLSGVVLFVVADILLALPAPTRLP